MGVSEKTISKPSRREYKIDEELLSSIMSEIGSLKNTVVELQHHLIGVGLGRGARGRFGQECKG